LINVSYQLFDPQNNIRWMCACFVFIRSCV